MVAPVSDTDGGSQAVPAKIWQVVSLIPKGKVASYGQVAQLAGLPRGARQVGRILSQLPKDTQLPWHRVINAQGKISFPENSTAYRKQKQRLREEGVQFKNGRVVLKQFGWQP